MGRGPQEVVGRVFLFRRRHGGPDEVPGVTLAFRARVEGDGGHTLRFAISPQGPAKPGEPSAMRLQEAGSHRHILPGRVHRNEVEAGGAVDLEIVPIRFQGRSEVGSGDPGEAAGVPRCAEALEEPTQKFGAGTGGRRDQRRIVPAAGGPSRDREWQN